MQQSSNSHFPKRSRKRSELLPKRTFVGIACDPRLTLRRSRGRRLLPGIELGIRCWHDLSQQVVQRDTRDSPGNEQRGKVAHRADVHTFNCTVRQSHFELS